jgi:hypothetical protein
VHVPRASFGDVSVIVGSSWRFQLLISSIDRGCNTMHEVIEVLPCKAAVLRQYYA